MTGIEWVCIWVSASAMMCFAIAWTRRKRRWQVAMAVHCSCASIISDALQSGHPDIAREYMAIMQRAATVMDDRA